MLRGTCMLAALGAARALVLPRRCAARSLVRYATDLERGAPKLPKGQFRPKQSLGQNYLQDPNYAVQTRRLVSLHCESLRRFHFLDMSRLRERRSWVVSFSILRPFGPSRETAHFMSRGDSARTPRASPSIRRRHVPQSVAAKAELEQIMMAVSYTHLRAHET